MRLVTRAEWGAHPAASRSVIGKTDGVALHWNGPRLPLADHALCAAAVRRIQAFHMSTRKWADIAYTALVCPHGWVYEGRGVGTRTAANGTDEGNRHFYAVCYLGGEGDPLTSEAKSAIRDAVWWLQTTGAGSEVRSHSDFKATTCPGDELRSHAGLVERQLRGRQDVKVQPASMVEVRVPVVAVLRLNAQGKWVRKMQALLLAHGHVVAVDGDFGPKTEQALNRHKTAHGLAEPNTCDEAAWLSLVEK